jgi:hypothetical protein
MSRDTLVTANIVQQSESARFAWSLYGFEFALISPFCWAGTISGSS